MNTERLTELLHAGDTSALEPLCVELVRRGDHEATFQALESLHTPEKTLDVALWLAHVADDAALTNLRVGLLALSAQWPAGLLRALYQNLLSGDYRLIPAGAFKMGSTKHERGHEVDEVRRDVEICRPFLLKTTPVTQREWRDMMGNNPSRFKGDDNRPVEMVNWYDAVAYCHALSDRDGLDRCYEICDHTGTPGEKNYQFPDSTDYHLNIKGYRLPSEAEWEYAARADTKTAFYNGKITEPFGKDPNLEVIGWYAKNAKKTQPVRTKQPNAWGLYDMLGNVYEWCNDWFVRDPRKNAATVDEYRVIRGGAWDCNAEICRAAHRDAFPPADLDNNLGFRPARAFL